MTANQRILLQYLQVRNHTPFLNVEQLEGFVTSRVVSHGKLSLRRQQVTCHQSRLANFNEEGKAAIYSNQWQNADDTTATSYHTINRYASGTYNCRKNVSVNISQRTKLNNIPR
jgi:hypothetical protein